MKEEQKMPPIIGLSLTTFDMLFSHVFKSINYLDKPIGVLCYVIEAVKIYFPIATLLIVSIILSIVFL